MSDVSDDSYLYAVAAAAAAATVVLTVDITKRRRKKRVRPLLRSRSERRDREGMEEGRER